MSIDETIGFVGAGNMAEALMRGLLDAGELPPANIGAADPRSERTDELAARFGIRTSTSNTEIVEHSQIVVLSVKPQVITRVLDEVRDSVAGGTLFISIAAGTNTASIEARLPPGTRVVRAMPNTPALVGAGATAIAAGAHATANDLALATRIFDAVGLTVTLPESQLDAVTGLSGSGPAYVFVILEALAEGGVAVGLSPLTASLLAAQTVMGAAKLALETSEVPARLRDRVTSPGGTTVAGLHALEAGGLRSALINAVAAATDRSRELGVQ